MKIKDLLEFNPEADIEIIMPTGVPYVGKLDLGWSGGEGESEGYKKDKVKLVCIFLGNFAENTNKA